MRERLDCRTFKFIEAAKSVGRGLIITLGHQYHIINPIGGFIVHARAHRPDAGPSEQFLDIPAMALRALSDPEFEIESCKDSEDGF